MILAMLVACEEPGLLSSVTEELGARTVEQATDGIRLFVASASIVGETCGVDDVGSHTFIGAGATLLGASVATPVESSQAPTWVFSDVQFGGDTGDLHLATDEAGEDYTVSWQGGGDSLVAAFTVAWCDSSVPEVVVAGTGNHVVEGEGRPLDTDGPAPYPGLRFEPITGWPTSGYVTWVWPGSDGREGNEDDRTLVLDDASTLDEDEGTWTGTASGSTWSDPVVLPFL